MLKFVLTSSQMNFYTNCFFSEETLWNQGGILLFDKKYSYQKLNDALNSLIMEHDFTRLRIKATNNSPVAYINEFETVKSPFYSFQTVQKLEKFVCSYINTPIDIQSNMFNVAVFELPKQIGIFANIHHLIIDGLSMTVMTEYINQFLKNDFSITTKPQSYEEYFEKETLYKQSKRYIADRKFWKEQFSSAPMCSVFSKVVTVFDYSSSECNFNIYSDLFSKIKSFCNDIGISVQTYFNTVYAMYVYKTSGYDKFTIGVPVLNRTTEAELNTIGLYMHIVPLIINIKSGSFLENALDIEDSQMNLFRHQKFTQYDIKEMLKEQGTPVNSLFDIVCDYQELEESEDYEFKFVYSNSLSVPIEIHLQSFGKEKHNLKIRYRTAMFSEKEIQTMMNSIINIAQDVLENPDKKISELDMISPEEKKKVLYDFNNTHHIYDVPEHSTLYSLFEKTAKENEEKVCITTSDGKLTFGELINISEYLDKKIRAVTDGKKSVIAVIAERSLEMYAAIYGIIRGGNAYLPISPDYPQERIDYILENSSAKLVIAQNSFTHLAGDVPCVDMTEFIKNKPAVKEHQPSAALPSDTAYVIYTSGSTGNPKGAKVSHKSAVNRILWMHDKYPLEENGVILQKTPYTFDVSVWEIFWWGMCGGSLAVSKPGEHFLPGKILDEVYNNKVTHLHFVPSVFELFLNYLEKHKDELHKFDSVKYIFLSGEALSASLAERFYNLFNYEKVTLHNLYGPTECAVDVTYYDCTPYDIAPVPIGRPIYNTSLYVVDKYINVLPIGVKGELCIGGVNVGQGYLNNEELTAEKFIDNPFGEGKLYKTGDLAYWREDGQLIFCGRMDGQIKLNGQRIEIGEIEAVIESIPEVETAAVIMRKVNGQDILAAFYCGKINSEDAIKSVCISKLPKYMHPTAICHIEKMPLNQSGKLDRKSLSAMEIAITEVSAFEAPVNKDEEYICKAFSKALNVETIGRNSDFFASGGSSLSMIALLSDDAFSAVTAADFIANPTPAELAELIKTKRKTQMKYLEPLWEPKSSEKAIVLFPFAGGGAEAYTSLVNSIKDTNSKISLYFVRYLHTKDECVAAAEEISSILSEVDIYFYSHCVGSAVAMSILNFLEKDKRCCVKHYIAGASIPPKKSAKKNLWNIVPDKVLKTILVNAGAPLKTLSDENIHQMLKNFRTDTDFATEYFAQSNSTIKCPVSVVISKNDIFTSNYKKAEKLWKMYAETVADVHLTDFPSHYFQSENSYELARIIMSIIN